MLHRFVYTSRSASPLGLSPFTAADVLGHAQDANRRRNITGCMVMQGPHILQVLEGQRGDLDGLIDLLKADPRHVGMRVLSYGPITQRTFQNPMNLCSLANGLLQRVGLESIADIDHQDIEPLIALHRQAA